MNVQFITVAAADSIPDCHADFVCTGKNDEVILQKALAQCAEEKKNLFLYNGVYHIDSFADFGDGGPRAALRLPCEWRDFVFAGDNYEYGCQKSWKNGVVIYVSQEALKSIGKEESADVIRGTWSDAGVQNGSSLQMKNISVVLADNQHRVRCIDLRRTDRVDVKNVTLLGYGDNISEDSELGLGTPPPVPAEGCIGLTMTDGSNYPPANYTNILVFGFDEGFQVGGEHVVCINCGASGCRYGYTFGNYEYNCGNNHPITLINCLDERNINLPLFNRCGDHDRSGKPLQGGQEVTMISHNLEWVADRTPGMQHGSRMREVYPGTWCGNIDFTAQPGWWQTNTEDFQLWEYDGSGSGFRTRNNVHKQVCSSEERLRYSPFIGQQVFDTTLNRMLVCIDSAEKKWVDFQGNPAE